jgi:hypothetical protein
MAEVLFWGAVAFIVYAYVGYAGLLLALSIVRRRPLRKADITPRVSFIITAHNEERRIRHKIENTLKQTYPRARLQLIVASDCSSDGTDQIVKSYDASGVRLVGAPDRKGKEAAQRLAIDAASGDILIFSDVATTLPPDAVAKIVRPFADTTVGCVSSVDRSIDHDGNVSGEGAYVRYEMFVRRLETKVNSLVGLSGSLFAARRDVCRDWAVDRPSDFTTLLNAVKMGLRGVSEPDALCYYANVPDDGREFQRKVRTVVRGISAFMNSPSVLDPLRYGLFSWQLLSHKLCRWLVPLAMIVAMLANSVLVASSPLYVWTFILQSVFYLVAIAGLATGAGLLRLPAFLLLVNLSILSAWYRYFRGDRMVVWQPSERLVSDETH